MFVAWKTRGRTKIEGGTARRGAREPPPHGRGSVGSTGILTPSRFPGACFFVSLFLLVTACQQPTRQAAQPQAPATSAPAPAAKNDQPPAKRTPQADPTVPIERRPTPPADQEQSGLPEPPRPAFPKDNGQEARRLAEIARLLAEAKPKRPTPSWVIFREAFDEAQDATCAADWTGGNRLEVHTDNIKRLTLDLHRLPSGAPQRGPWNLQLDGQGIQITGFHGKVLDLVRSKAGNWTVDRSKFKK